MEEYNNAVWEIHEEVGENLTLLFRKFNDNSDTSDMKNDALQSLELAQDMGEIFNNALQELDALEAPGNMASLDEELRAYYQDGVSLSKDLADAFDHLYEVSGILEEFMNEALTTLDLDLASAASSDIVVAINNDVARLKKLSQEILSASSSGGPMESFDAYLSDFFSQLADTMNKYSDAISSNQPEARRGLQADLTMLMQGFSQQMGQGLPGLGELLKRRDDLKSRYYELEDEINLL